MQFDTKSFETMRTSTNLTKEQLTEKVVNAWKDEDSSWQRCYNGGLEWSVTSNKIGGGTIRWITFLNIDHDFSSEDGLRHLLNRFIR